MLVSLKIMKVALVTTGGTIASIKDKSGGATPALSGESLLEEVPSIKHVASVSSITEFSQVPSQYLDFNKMLDLSRKVLEIIDHENPDGIVITMGTNSMEEDAYFLDLVLETDTPIIITGAMRNKSLPSSDVDINIHNAFVAASSAKLRGQGVVVAANAELHQARYVMKTHTTSVATFKSPDSGPL
jgi:L-asparaginase